MALRGIDTNRKNPPYTIDDFIFWIPNMANFIQTKEGLICFNRLYDMANNEIFFSIFGSSWQYAMSLYIAHFIYRRGKNASRNVGNTLADAAASAAYNGAITSVSVGGFSKSYDTNATTITDREAAFWNLSPYGTELYDLMSRLPIATIAVVTCEKTHKPCNIDNDYFRCSDYIPFIPKE